MGWRLIGGGEFDCLREKLKKMRMVIIIYHVREDQIDKRGRRGERRKDELRITAKHKHFLFLGAEAKNNFDFFFVLSLFSKCLEHMILL